jgi:hypothetical protein
MMSVPDRLKTEMEAANYQVKGTESRIESLTAKLDKLRSGSERTMYTPAGPQTVHVNNSAKEIAATEAQLHEQQALLNQYVTEVQSKQKGLADFSKSEADKQTKDTDTLYAKERTAQQQAADHFRAMQRRKSAEALAANELHKRILNEEEKDEEQKAAIFKDLAAEQEKVQQRMAKEELRHSEEMARLNAKDDGPSVKGEEKRYQSVHSALERERSLLRSAGLQRIADERAIDHAEQEEKLKHENKMTELARRGTQLRADMVKALAQMTIFEHKSMASALGQIGQQMLSAIISNTIQELMVRKTANEEGKLSDAGSAASSAFSKVMHSVPFPLDFVLAPAAAAAAFAGVMAFEKGGEIPGSGAVPIIAHGGESVVTKALTDQVRNNRGGGHGHITINMPPIQALDHHGVDHVLKKHATTISRHVTAELRKRHMKG